MRALRASYSPQGPYKALNGFMRPPKGLPGSLSLVPSGLSWSPWLLSRLFLCLLRGPLLTSLAPGRQGKGLSLLSWPALALPPWASPGFLGSQGGARETRQGLGRSQGDLDGRREARTRRKGPKRRLEAKEMPREELGRQEKTQGGARETWMPYKAQKGLIRPIRAL